ncbi:MAG: UDP-N-acetylmuramate dehydrogenase [Pyrinomonadaceae bacterium]
MDNEKRTMDHEGMKSGIVHFPLSDVHFDNSAKTIEIQSNISLAPFTTMKIGGKARFFVKAGNEQQVADAVGFAKKNDLGLFVLGGGSNILVSDKGFDGLVLQIALKGIEDCPGQDFGLTVKAGENWDAFVAYCVERDLAGIECLSGIPGFVGGTPVQNVGAYGQEVSETIVSVRCLDRNSGEIVELSNAECGFSYRTSIFNSTMRDRFIVLAVTYRLKKGGVPKIVYKDLREYFGGTAAALAKVRKAVLNIRAAKSMVIDANDPNSQSAGSFFKNPIVPGSIITEIGVENIPHFPVDEETVKIPAAWLIETAGFYKGYKLGNVGISTKHSLALINLGGGTAEEILALTGRIQAEVESKFGISLQPEPIFVGF